MPFFQHIDPSVIVDDTLYTLMAFSVITWTVIFFKVWQYAKNAHDNKRYNEAFWNAADLNAAQKIDDEVVRGPEARIAQCGFQWLNDLDNPALNTSLKYRGTHQELLEQALRKQTHEEQRKMESGLTMLASIGSTAPFVGLFGTVLGIMHAMHGISEAGSASLDVVAGPIGDALIATAIGIAVAVPAVLAYNFFIRRAKHQRASLEYFVDGFLHIAFGAPLNKEQE
jgi:biopolymer transport protein ExbB